MRKDGQRVIAGAGRGGEMALVMRFEDMALTPVPYPLA